MAESNRQRTASASRLSGQKMPGSRVEMLAEMKNKSTILAALL